MKKFQILRYFRSWWWIIVVLNIVGGVAFYAYISSSQSYRAQMSVAYTNAMAQNGLNPDGSPFSANEITSPSVLTIVVDSLKTDKTIADIRSGFDIEEVIPDDIRAIQAGAWQDGLEYEYYPTEFIISYEAANSEAARHTLETLLDCYITFYTEKYLSIPQHPGSISSIRFTDYDYLEYAEVLENFVRENRTYLMNMSGIWPSFRSSGTGYTFQDLLDEYNLLLDNDIPRLYAQILSNAVTHDAQILTHKYQYIIDENLLRIEDNDNYIQQMDELLKAYTEKNRENMRYHWMSDGTAWTNAPDGSMIGGLAAGSSLGQRYVLSQVYDFDKGAASREATTYDQMITQFVLAKSKNSELTTQNTFYQFFLSAYDGVSGEHGKAHFAAIDTLIGDIFQRLTQLDQLVQRTSAEHSQYIGPQNIMITSSANVFATKSIKLYLVLALFLFFFVGCICVIILGRGLDFLDYALYVDHTTNLPNRSRCDLYIAKYADRPLPFNFTCMTVVLDNIVEINRDLGRDGGNQVLRLFSSYLRDAIPEADFVGYNGNMRFLCLLPKCNEARAAYYHALFDKRIEEFNRGDNGVSLEYRIGFSTVTEKNPSTIHELISSTLRQLNTNA